MEDNRPVNFESQIFLMTNRKYCWCSDHNLSFCWYPFFAENKNNYFSKKLIKLFMFSNKILNTPGCMYTKLACPTKWRIQTFSVMEEFLSHWWYFRVKWNFSWSCCISILLIVLFPKKIGIFRLKKSLPGENLENVNCGSQIRYDCLSFFIELRIFCKCYDRRVYLC